MILPSWGSLGSALGALLDLLGASWGLLGRLLGPPGDFLGREARNVGWCSPSREPLGAFLGPPSAVLGAYWGRLGLFWCSRQPFGPSWVDLGGFLGRLKSSEARTGEDAKNIEKLNANR